VLAERDAGLARLGEAQRHEPVAEDDGLLLAAVTVDVVDQVADLALGQQLVDQVEADQRAARQDLAEEHAARRRLDAAHARLAISVDALEARLDLGVQRYRLCLKGLLDLADI